MKRSGFQKRISKPMRRTPIRKVSLNKVKKPVKPRKPLKKKSKEKISKIQREIWELCRQIATIIYPPDCYTCDSKGLVGSNRQLGHLWAKASLGAYLKYELKILRWQCFRCNINFGGQGAIFYKKIVNEIGEEEIRKLEQDKNKIVNAYDHYVILRDKYKTLLDSLQK